MLNSSEGPPRSAKRAKLSTPHAQDGSPREMQADSPIATISPAGTKPAVPPVSQAAEPPSSTAGRPATPGRHSARAAAASAKAESASQEPAAAKRGSKDGPPAAKKAKLARVSILDAIAANQNVQILAQARGLQQHACTTGCGTSLFGHSTHRSHGQQCA